MRWATALPSTFARTRATTTNKCAGRQEEFSFVAHFRTRGEEATEKKARRWPVERTHSWMNRLRSVFSRRAKKERNYLAMLHFVRGLISCRTAGLFE